MLLVFLFFSYSVSAQVRALAVQDKVALLLIEVSTKSAGRKPTVVGIRTAMVEVLNAPNPLTRPTKLGVMRIPR